MKLKQPIALLLAVLLALSATACGTRQPEPSDLDIPEPEPVSAGAGYVFLNTLPELIVNTALPRLTAAVKEKYALNSDSVGWLRVPGTHIDDVVLQKADDTTNSYYERRGFDKEYSWVGVFYADFRSTMGDLTRTGVSKNTVIYGHTMSTDPDGVKFAPMLYFMNEDFARQTPYIYFSTQEEDMVWEVFAVFYATVSLPYNRADLTDEEFTSVISECRQRSLYTYNTQVTAQDKVLTLSTCCYDVPKVGVGLSYPNKYRYVIMAKLVDRAAAVKTEADFTPNPDHKEP